jgi:hypothetical protein
MVCKNQVGEILLRTELLQMTSNALKANHPAFEFGTTEANGLQTSYEAPLTPLETLTESSLNLFAAFDDWGSFADPSAFLEGMDLRLPSTFDSA